MTTASQLNHETDPTDGGATDIPAWYPDWARELAELYYSGSTCLFVLHGNVHDLVRCPGPDGDRFVGLREFLAEQLFGSWDVMLSYDLGRGLRPEAGSSRSRLQEMVQYVAGIIGGAAKWPRDPDKALDAIDQIVQRNLLDETQRLRVAFFFEHAQFMIPAGDLAMLARGQASRLVRLLSWASSPFIKRVNMTFCLVTEKLSELNDRLVENPNVATIEIPMPDATARCQFIEAAVGAAAESRLGGLSAEAVSELSSGLNLVNLNAVLTRSGNDGQALDMMQFRRLKKSMIERQCQGLVTFVEPAYTLDFVVGHESVKQRLRQDAKWIGEGRLDAAPMGYLVCGPVGTGKTFLAECYAGSIGIACVTLRNFRSKYVGETEGNLEQMLNVLRSLGPVVVIVDEADAALGSREQDGDSGTSGRVFSMIASQMGDTRYRGRIVWMLLTSRPDLLPIDLKRQGRAEVHVPLFYPQEESEIVRMFQVMARKNKVRLADDAAPKIEPGRNLSGADIESIVLGARRAVMIDGREQVEATDLTDAYDAFLPSAQGLEKEMQELAAALECTDRSFLPEDWARRFDEPGGRAKLQQRLVDLRSFVRN